MDDPFVGKGQGLIYPRRVNQTSRADDDVWRARCTTYRREKTRGKKGGNEVKKIGRTLDQSLGIDKTNVRHNEQTAASTQAQQGYSSKLKRKI